MTENENKEYAFYSKVVWAIYILIAILLILVLVFLVAEDNEEKLFFSLMTAAAFYVFRPTDRFFRKQVARIMDLAEKRESK